MESNTQCIVIFPAYKAIDKIEKAYFEQAVRITSDYQHVFIAPESFELDESFGDLRKLKVIRFEDSYFQNIEGYNRLMLSIDFYNEFTDYEYMLIHQSDVYLFGTTSLQYWCDKGYDYIGAPWVRPKKSIKSYIYKTVINIFPKLYPKNKKKLHECYNTVGNGGLSLRKIKTFINILQHPKTKDILSLYMEQLVFNPLYNEDIFWSVEGPRIFKKFSKPSWKKASTFSIETYPSYLYKLTNETLPFGCHAPFVYEPEFWKKHIPMFPSL